MLKLKRVEIQGFKSFYDRTEMKFNGSGIAAVVGPNGCGKSNLSDAISWVLGEQSAKSLRGARMEDVIFAGTRDKKALGMAHVTMTLVPDEAVFAREAAPKTPDSEADKTATRTGEITITRRLYRSGESEYLINGKLARLRDIQDLFLGTGLGPESYAIIEQGRIGQILSNRPQDRRNVIEEAAGITRFKARKRLAEAKLESAKQNLARVFDILEEVNRQVNSLRRQAAKTKRYGELNVEATGFLRQLLSAKFHMLERQMAQIVIELNLASNEIQSVHAAIAEKETEQTGALEKSYANENELTRERKQLADLKVELERARGRLEYQSKQIDQIERRLGSGEGEVQSLDAQVAERAREFEAHGAELEGLDGECGRLREELDAKSAERQSAQSHLAERDRALEGLRQGVLRILGEASGLKNRITQLEAHLASAEREKLRAENEEKQSESDLGRIQRLKAEISDRLQLRQTDLISVKDQRTAIEEELAATRASLRENRQGLDHQKSEFSRIKARKDSLEELIQHRSYTTETVKRLFTAVERGKAHNLQPVGVLADFLEVDRQLEKAAEEFLHDELEFVVVRDWSEAERGVEYMRAELGGRATFLPEQGDEIPAELDLPQPQLEGGQVQKLTDSLRLTNGLTGLPIAQVPRIAQCYIVEQPELARELATHFPHCWFLLRDGVSYHGRTVAGGKKSGAGPLALKRELREVSELEARKRAELETLQTTVADLDAAGSRLSEELETLRSRQQAQEKDVLALDHESRKLAEEFQRVQTRLSNARLELERLSRERIKAQETLAKDQEALGVVEGSRAAQEEMLAEAREQLVVLQQAVARAGEEHASMRAALASAEERRRSVAAQRGRLETQIRDLTSRRNDLISEAERLTGERANLIASNAELQTATVTLNEAQTSAEAGIAILVERETELRASLNSLEEELKRLRAHAQVLGEKRSALQVDLARAESELKHLEETSQKELEAPLASLASEGETIPDEAALEGIEAKYGEVRKKIEALGPVNPQALEEFEDAQQRQEFLQAQRQDLLDSIRDTEGAIGEIDAESRKRFGEAFTAINANFREMFKVLFGGGTGEMRLTDEENLAESGIDIVASPPGKRLQSVLLLSGGEKSLTAMALLMGIFQYTPSPFCILDEVDAPLDEPNIERLTKMLKGMAEQTQFIVITHSKRTMEAAQSLYGVTMQEPGVSKLVSVRFNEPEKARAQAAGASEPAEQQELEPVLA
ncbi:MAG: chromosome segregation protein SMC [Bryobacteraceae bacterium]